MIAIVTIIAVIVFLLVIWALVGILLFARKKLVPEGNVTLNINKEHNYEQERGVSLLQALSSQQIFISSACGGGGTCGFCKGIVHTGGGDILPTETSHLSRKEQEEQYRLFCQVKVRNDMEIEIPEEVFGVKKWECTVLSNDNIATYIKELVVQMPDGEILDFKSGSYIQIDVPPTVSNYSDMEISAEYRPEWEQKIGRASCRGTLKISVVAV